MVPVFSENSLSHFINEFRLSSVTGIRHITLEIKLLVQELESGKFDSLKEEEIKSRFINTFFGDILGFNYQNAGKWLLREEKKSTVDGTKPDAALGYFFSDKKMDKVHIVVELKDANTALDAPQKRPDRQTPVEQAFEYVAKMGGTCKWVVVSNIKEIRFYPALDQSKCQVFYLKELIEEKPLKELLFLFHKDRFVREEALSPTDRLYEKVSNFPIHSNQPLHIVDQLYNCLKGFEGLQFIDPNYLAAIPPFNILDEHVWHYEQRSLFTVNPAIYSFLKEVTVHDSVVHFSEALQKELQAAGVVEAEDKVNYVFRFLNQCFIYQISAIRDYVAVRQRNLHTIGFSHRVRFHFKEGEEGVIKNIMVVKQGPCDCLSCNYRNFNFRRLLEKLKVAEGNEDFHTMEYAYGDYLVATNNFKATYNKLRSIEKESKGKQGESVAYFLAKRNLLLLHNLVSDYTPADRDQILGHIRAIDLDKVIYDEIEFDVEKEVRNYLVRIKDDHLVYKLQDDIFETVQQIEELKIRYQNGGGQSSGPNLWQKLSDLYFLLYLHINLNFIVYDNFNRYRSLAHKVFQGLVWSYQTPHWGIPWFNSFLLTEAILFVSREKLRKVLEEVEELNVEPGTTEAMLDKLIHFTTSYYDDGIFGDPTENQHLKIQLNNYRFKDNFTNIFANLFIVLSRLPISNEDFQRTKPSLFKFLQVETDLYWYHIEDFCEFVRLKVHLFEATELESLLTIAIHADRYGFNKYSNMIERVARVLQKAYPEYKIARPKLISTAIGKASSDSGEQENYMHLIDLLHIADEEGSRLLHAAFENYLDKTFHADFYEKLLLKTDYDYKKDNYFMQYTTYVNTHKGGRTHKVGKQELTDLRFYNFIIVVYIRNIDLSRPEFTLLTGLNKFEAWLLNPAGFDYTHFDACWLVDLEDTIIIEKLQGNKDIALRIEAALQAAFHPVLARLKYTYFKES